MFRKLVTRVASLYIFASIFCDWLNKRQLDSHVCFHRQPVAICCFCSDLRRKSDLTQLCGWKREVCVHSPFR